MQRKEKLAKENAAKKKLQQKEQRKFVKTTTIK